MLIISNTGTEKMQTYMMLIISNTGTEKMCLIIYSTGVYLVVLDISTDTITRTLNYKAYIQKLP
jgi:hypothetical protein